MSIVPLVFGVAMDLPPMLPPDAPTAVTAQVDGSNLVVTWDTSAPYGLPAHTFYDCDYQVLLDGSAVWSQGEWPDQQTVVPLGSLSGKHVVKVRAANRFGLGPWSHVLHVNLSPPDPLMSLAVLGFVGRARVDWVAAASGQPAVSYDVVSESGSVSRDQLQKWGRHQRAEGSPTTVDAFAEGQTYSVGVFPRDAENQLGTGLRVVLHGTVLRLRPSTRLEAGSWSLLAGRVRRADSDLPLTGAVVRVLQAPAGDPSRFTRTGVTAVTDAAGHFALQLRPSARYVSRVVMVGAPGLAGSWSRVVSVA